ncbi:peptidoglycan-binding protein [Actinoplanes sp. TRM 88003]|uniref:Peptidoglycan-binding protein n=1 Tax=Paractinoplanes aksuensis TaxID=2939490 RepID=A0ABT1DW34_9ACTN|nr:peptidoglycan-binding domain-containing protein [Actinoplanes aksuensis]MCO8275059.1 peptidoglycan-binding protein [Actinoplanes aksuensis]
MMTKRLRAIAVATAIAGGSAVVLAPAPAQAALPNCNTSTQSGGPIGPRFATFSGNKNCVMGVGNASSGVWALQMSLRYCYGQNLTVDSAFGNQTRNALINVQRTVGTSADGVYGPATGGRMVWSLGGGLPGCAPWG